MGENLEKKKIFLSFCRKEINKKVDFNFMSKKPLRWKVGESCMGL